jgi:hypothetical protein
MMASMKALRAVVLLASLGACSSEPTPTTTSTTNGAKAPKQPDAKPEPDTTKQPELPPLDRSCKADADCVPAPGCCPAPCSGSVINVAALDEAQRRLDCPTPLECPAAGACVTHAYLCVEGTCMIAFEGDPHYRERR